MGYNFKGMNTSVLQFVNCDARFIQAIAEHNNGFFSFYKAENSLAALEIIHKEPVHLIIFKKTNAKTDLPLFLQSVSKIRPGISVIILADSGDEADLPAAINTGILRGYFIAPWDPKEILSVCQEVVLGEIARSMGLNNDVVKKNSANLQREIQLRSTIQDLLQTEKELLSTTLMSMGEGVIVTDETNKIILFNRAAELLTGYDALEAVESPLSESFKLCDSATLQPYPDLVQAMLKMDLAEKSGGAFHQPTLLTKSQERILISVNLTPRKSEFEHTSGYVIIFEDVTEKQKFAAQTALSQKMEAIGQLAAGIAHEINTPIQYIGDNLRFLHKAFSRYSETLSVIQQIAHEQLGNRFTQDDIDVLDNLIRTNKIPRYNTEIPTAITEALDGIERVRKIVLAMREFSHPTEREKKLADINHGIETTATISRNEWKYCAELTLDLDLDIPLVECQIDEINQVVLNMIVNGAQAIQEKNQATPGQKGEISIKTRTIPGNKVSISISDTGVGIPKGLRDRIFDPFFTTKGIGRGTGQGLSVAQNIIVKKHQGLILVESQPNQGTTFTIELPISTGPVGDHEEP